MYAAILDAAGSADIYIAAAAVGDFRPAEIAAHKIKKSGRDGLSLDLTQNPDILDGIGKLPKRPFLVGFAAETENLEGYARGKLERKRLDMIAANRVGGGLGFEAEDNTITLIAPDATEQLPTLPKRDLANLLIERIAARYHAARKTNPA
jgi:phosphopantothenoylcysteine decarboxylase / phosphopantothenate---cysteine ligase